MKQVPKGPLIQYELCEAPRPQAGASRARSAERKASKGNIVLIVPLNPAYKEGACGALADQKGVSIKLFITPFRSLNFFCHYSG